MRLARCHPAKTLRAQVSEHSLIVYCKQHPEMKIVEAIDVIFKRQQWTKVQLGSSTLRFRFTALSGDHHTNRC
ncbi:hypothetical protein UB31_07120 [Bradyrhizobium sp. LTSP849]|nr:hypothetical protein UB31_07120 [Bradyrhizobium sp. LTSP849]